MKTNSALALLGFMSAAASLLGCTLVGPSVAAAADEKPLKVFILAGTSNMLGRTTKPEDLPDDLQKPLADVLAYRDGDWTPLEAGKNLVGNEATFGRALAAHLGEPVGIVWISAASSSDKSPAPASRIFRSNRSRKVGRSSSPACSSTSAIATEATRSGPRPTARIWLAGSKRLGGSSATPICRSY
jgi:hypothetical protein